LAARLNRHLRGHGKQRWHIDYLRQITRPIGVWLAPDARLECTWAQTLQQLPQARTPIPGFGASDCRCAAHLFAFDDITTDSIILPNNPIFITV
jgi:Uri superfamily endonuclease